jgi:hypothetical protein
MADICRIEAASSGQQAMTSHSSALGGVLAVWTDIPPEIEADFNEWYWREHFPERLSVPGFLSARRYRAVSGSPRYFACYELEGAETLASPAYRQQYENPTAWTKRVTSNFRNYTRAVYRTIARRGSTAGAFMFTLRLPAAANALPADLLPELAAQRGVLRVQLWRAAEPEAPATDQTTIVVEAADAEDLAAPADRLRAIGTAAATYRFLCSLHPSP